MRLVAVDLDGTLLRSGSTDLSGTILELRGHLRHHKYQVRLTLATGRTMKGVRTLVRDMGIPHGMPLILYNGSVVAGYQGTRRDPDLLYRRAISPEVLQRILRALSRYSVRVLAYVFSDPKERWFWPDDANERVLGWSSIDRPEREFNGMPVSWLDSDDLHLCASPSAVLVDTCEAPDMEPAIVAELSGIQEISCTQSGHSYVEVRPLGSHKGAALGHAAERLGISCEEVLALGDNDNDCEMLERAGIGVAVAGASSAALARSDYVCHHGAVTGAIEVLRLVKSAGRYFFRPDSD